MSYSTAHTIARSNFISAVIAASFEAKPDHNELDYMDRSHLAKLILRHAVTYERIQISICNDDISEREEKRREHREQLIEARITALVHALGLEGVKFNGDPRGFTVSITGMNVSNSWNRGHYGVPVPELS